MKINWFIRHEWQYVQLMPSSVKNCRVLAGMTPRG